MKKLVSVLALLSAFGLLMAAEKVFQHEEFSAYDVQNIEVEASSGNVKVVSDSNSKIIVETYSNKKKVTEAKINMSGGTLSVDATDWSFDKHQPNVRIFLPKNFSFDNLDLKLSSGNVDIDGVECEEINVTLTSGDLEIDDSSIAGDIKIKSTSGNLDVDDVDCANFKAELTSGNIDVDNLSCKEFEANATSGRIICEDLICEKFTADAHSGNIEVELSELPSQKSLLKTNSGNVTLILPKKNDGYSATVNTSSGRFTDEFTGMKANNCTGANSVYNNGGIEFALTTNSGNVKIEKAR